MNKAKIIELMEDGATFDRKNCKFFHPSFRKGYRKMTSGNISWQAVEREHGQFRSNRLKENENGVYSLESA